MKELIYELINPLYYGKLKTIHSIKLQKAYQDYLKEFFRCNLGLNEFIN